MQNSEHDIGSVFFYIHLGPLIPLVSQQLAALSRLDWRDTQRACLAALRPFPKQTQLKSGSQRRCDMLRVCYKQAF